MKTIIIYKDSGEIIFSQSGQGVSADGGANIIETDIPDGYYVKSVNTETGEPVLEEIPKSDEQQQIDELKKTVAELQAASDEQKRITDVIIGATESEETA